MVLRTGSIWATLGLPATADRAEIRRAYSKLLKATNPEDDPDGFQQLRAAYEQALSLVDGRARQATQALVDSGERPSQPQAESNHHEDLGAAATAGVSHGEVAELQAAFDRLRRLVETPSADPYDLVDAFKEGLRSAALESVTVRDQAEAWIAFLILQSAPRADGLIEPAIEAFRWNDSGIGSTESLAAAVVARQKGLRAVSSVSRRSSPHNVAFKALAERPTGWRLWRNRLTPGLAEKVRLLLSSPEAELLRPHLNADAYSWWFTRIDNRRPWLQWSITAFIMTALVALFIDDVSETGGLTPWAASCAIILVTALGALLASSKLRETLAKNTLSQSPGLRLGWVGLTLATLTASAILPGSLAALVAIVAASLLSLFWALAFAAPDRSGPYPFSLWFYVVIRLNMKLSRDGMIGVCLFPLLLYMLALNSDLPKGVWGQVSLAVIGAGAALAVGFSELQGAWLSIRSVRTRISILAAITMLAAFAPFLLWATAPTSPYTAAAAVGVALLMLTHMVMLPDRLGLGTRTAISNFAWLPLTFVGVIVGQATGQGHAVLLFGGIWILGVTVAGLVGSFREEVLAHRSDVAHRRPA